MNFTFIRNPKEFGNVCGFQPRQSQSSHKHTDTHNNEHILGVQKYKDWRLGPSLACYVTKLSILMSAKGFVVE